MLLLVGPIVVSLLGLLAMYGLASKWRYCWTIYLIVQMPAIAYDVVTKQYGFIPFMLGSMVIALRGRRNNATN